MVTVTEKVRFVETDMMGVVHHSNYFRWFEIGRVDYLKQAGVDLLQLFNEGIIYPIRDVSCRYISSAKFNDIIHIETEMAEFSRAKMVFTYRILNDKGALLATGMTQNVFTNAEGKIIMLPSQYSDCVNEFMAKQKL